VHHLSSQLEDFCPIFRSPILTKKDKIEHKERLKKRVEANDEIAMILM
jgi:hypothetical protein